jgi:hypothetical protein
VRLLAHAWLALGVPDAGLLTQVGARRVRGQLNVCSLIFKLPSLCRSKT